MNPLKHIAKSSFSSTSCGGGDLLSVGGGGCGFLERISLVFLQLTCRERITWNKRVRLQTAYSLWEGLNYDRRCLSFPLVRESLVRCFG